MLLAKMMFSALKKYLNETPLHGFGYTVTNNKFLMIFWSLLTLTCVYFAIKDIVTLVENYQTVPVTTDFTMASSEDLVLPTPTLCMEMIVMPPEKRFKIEDIQADIKVFMITSRNTTKIHFDNSTQMLLTHRLEYLTYLMLGYITDYELLYTGDQRPLLTDYVFKFSNSSVKYAAMLQTVYDTYMDYNVTLGNLKRLVGMSICSRQFDTAHYGSVLIPGDTITSMCHANTITHLSFSLLCVKLFNSSTFKLTSGLTVSISGLLSASRVPFPVLKRMRHCRIANDNPDARVPTGVIFRWYVDMQGRSVFPRDSLQDVLVFDPAMPTNTFDVSVAAQFQQLDVANVRPCSKAQLQRRCEQQKKVEQLSATCNCWPSSLIDVVNTNQMPTCSGDRSNRIRNVTTNDSYQKCSQNVTVAKGSCINDCTSYLFTIAVVDTCQTANLNHIGVKLGNISILASVEIRFQTASLRVDTTEYLTMPLTAFLCSFGGTIGTYLGGSILAFIHIPIFILAQLAEVLTKRQKVGTTKQADEQTNRPTKEDIYPTVVAEAKAI